MEISNGKPVPELYVELCGKKRSQITLKNKNKETNSGIGCKYCTYVGKDMYMSKYLRYSS